MRRNIQIFVILILINISCSQISFLNKADQYSVIADSYYQKAIKEYKELILKNKANDEVYFKLGRLYFEHGEFPLAIEVFKKSNSIEAKKYLAISYYKIGDYTEALKIFDSLGTVADDFYLYYYGLSCEALNLYEQAKLIYRKVKSDPYQKLSQQNLDRIEQMFKHEISLKDRTLEKIFDKKFSKEFYPEAGALFILVDEEIEIISDNTAVYSGHFIIKILDDRGKKNFSEVIIDYDSTYEKPYLEFARTIKEDGVSVVVGKKHIRDVSRYLNFPLYSNARAMIISMPEVNVGCVIEYKFKIFKNQLIDKKHFSFSYFLQESEPIVEAKYSILVPVEMTLNIKILNGEYNKFNANIKPEIVDDKGKRRYMWEFKNIPKVISESYMPANVEINPAILVSTFRDWQEIYNWWWNLSKEKIRATAVIKEMVHKLTKYAKTLRDKAVAIYNFCARNIRYVAVEYGRAGYEPHSAEEIFLNKYGDCKDQSILLVTMLREAGIEAYPVLIGTRDYFNLSPDYPSVMFNHCIIMIELEGENIFLDPTCTTCSFGDLPIDDQERMVLVFKDNGFRIMQTPLFAPIHNRVIHSFKINLNEDGIINAKKEVVSLGFYNQAQRAWLLYSQPEIVRQTIEEAIQKISIGGKLNNYTVENLEDWNKPIILKYSIQGPFDWISVGDLRILPQLSELTTDLVTKQQRNYPLDLGFVSIEERQIAIDFPKNFGIRYLPENIYMDSKWMEFIAEYSIKERTLYFKEKKTFKERLIACEDYSHFRNFYQELLRKTKQQRIVLERITK
ncbi:MAG: DUF3857 domain-containing protein [Candidatus Omnitrophica bacterium]|nr:DUF3857 domain-containing protein [Candidatus Omnitrophota bacterium]